MGRYRFTIYAATDDSATIRSMAGEVEITPARVRIFGPDGDCELDMPVPSDEGEGNLLPPGINTPPPPPPAEQQGRWVRLATGGRDPEFDALGVLVEVLLPLPVETRDRMLGYCRQRFAGET